MSPLKNLERKTQMILSSAVMAAMIIFGSIAFTGESEALGICPDGWSSCDSWSTVGCCGLFNTGYHQIRHCTRWDNDIIQEEPHYCTYKVVDQWTESRCHSFGCF